LTLDQIYRANKGNRQHTKAITKGAIIN